MDTVVNGVYPLKVSCFKNKMAAYQKNPGILKHGSAACLQCLIGCVVC